MQQELESFFRFWRNQKLLLDALENSGLSGILMERAISNVGDSVRHIHTNENPKIRDHVVQFAVCGLMIMMVNWHHNGYQESVQEMTRIALRLVSQPLVSL